MSIQFSSNTEGIGAELSMLHMAAFPPGQGWKEKDFKGLLDISFHYLLVARDVNNRMTGFLLYALILDEAEIITFCVNVTDQNKGVGQAILMQFLTEMKHKQVKTVLLDVAENNLSAVKLYNRCGFSIDGKRPKYYENKTDALLMSKLL